MAQHGGGTTVVSTSTPTPTPTPTSTSTSTSTSTPSSSSSNRPSFSPIDFVDSDDSDLHVVQLDALVVMKIIKHCRENLPEPVTGQLLGLDFASTLEVTNCFPFPNREEEDDDADADSGREYQIEMMRCLREVNVDNNTVGWYQSGLLGSFVNESMIDNQFTYQSVIKKCVVVICDPLRIAPQYNPSHGNISSYGGYGGYGASGGYHHHNPINDAHLSLHAYRLTNHFMQLYRSHAFTNESISKAGLGFNDIFEEVRIEIKNGLLLNACLYELDESPLWAQPTPPPSFPSSSSVPTFTSSSFTSSITPFTPSRLPLPPFGTGWNGFEGLDVGTNGFLEKNVELVLESADDLFNDLSTYQFHLRTVQRYNNKLQQLILKKKADMAAAAAANNPNANNVTAANIPDDQVVITAEELASIQVPKPEPPPSRLNSLLFSNQINIYCQQINSFSQKSICKLHLFNALTKPPQQ